MTVNRSNADTVTCYESERAYSTVNVGQIVLRALQQASPARLDASGALNVLKAMYARK